MAEFSTGPQRPHILLHGTSKSYANLLPETGLLADGPTLTPSLGAIIQLNRLRESNKGFLTVWYPSKKLVRLADKDHPEYFVPSTPVPQSMKIRILAQTAGKFPSEPARKEFEQTVEKATTYLPPNTLKAIIVFNYGLAKRLEKSYESAFQTSFYYQYRGRRKELVNNLLDIFDSSEIITFDPKISSFQLAHDIIDGEFELCMQNLGINIRNAIQSQNISLKTQHEYFLRDTLLMLQSKPLSHPAYDKYRKLLIQEIVSWEKKHVKK